MGRRGEVFGREERRNGRRGRESVVEEGGKGRARGG